MAATAVSRAARMRSGSMVMGILSVFRGTLRFFCEEAVCQDSFPLRGPGMWRDR